ncbi:MAG: 50S ribosomal protein L9 [bacterium]|nr:50S ribosomal protein L9 [bacterium]
MRLILRKEVDHLGDPGDIVEVPDGYGLNYLVPHGLAIQATAGKIRATRHEMHLREAQLQAAKRQAEEEAGHFTGVEIEFTVRAGEDGRLFGSVTNRQIEAALAEKGFHVSRRRILLEEPIRKLGEYDVTIRHHQDVKSVINVRVVADESAPPDEEGAEEVAPAKGASDEAAAPEKAQAADPADGNEESA